MSLLNGKKIDDKQTTTNKQNAPYRQYRPQETRAKELFAFILSDINERIDLSGTLDFSKDLELHRTQSPGCHICLRQM